MTKPLGYCGLVAAALWLVSLHRGIHSPSVHAAVGTSPAFSENEPGAGPSSENGVRGPGAPPVARAAASTSMKATSPTVAPATKPIESAGGQFSHEQRWQTVAAAFAAERVDPSWRAQPDLRAFVAAALPDGSTLASLECKSSLCRVETLHADAAARSAFVSALAMPSPLHPPPFASALFDEESASDSHAARSVSYLLRPGREFPQVLPE